MNAFAEGRGRLIAAYAAIRDTPSRDIFKKHVLFPRRRELSRRLPSESVHGATAPDAISCCSNQVLWQFYFRNSIQVMFVVN